MCGNSRGSCLCGRFIFSLCGNSRGSCCLGRRCVFCLRSVSLCSLDHDCGSLAVLIAFSRLECLESLLFCCCSLKKCCRFLDTGIYGLCAYGNRGVVCSVIAYGSLCNVNRLGRGVGRLILSRLSSLSLRSVVGKKRISLCDAGIYPRILFYGSGRALIRRIIFGHGLGLSKICELLLCTDDSILFIVSGNVRSGSSIITGAEGDTCFTHLRKLIKLIHIASLLLIRFYNGKGHCTTLLVLLILLFLFAPRRGNAGCIYSYGSRSCGNGKGHSNGIGGEVDIIILIILVLLYLISKHRELSLLGLDNGLFSRRLASVFSILLILEGRELSLGLACLIFGVTLIGCLLAVRLGKGRRLSLGCRFTLFRLCLRGILCRSLLCLFLGLGRSFLSLLLRGSRSSVLCLFLGSGGGINLYLFLWCRGAYLSHILVFNLICHH